LKSDLARCSRVLVGALSAAALDARPDENGTTLCEAASAAGYGGASHQVRCCLHASASVPCRPLDRHHGLCHCMLLLFD
jgi:hypothetical protein